MRALLKPSLFAFAAILSAALSVQARAGSCTMNESDFKTYHEYLDALQDKRVLRMKPAQRLPAIAKNFKVPVGKLKGIVDQGQQWGSLDEMGKDCEAAIKTGLEGTPLAGRLDHVQVDVGNAHVVSYVSWVADDLDKLEEEAVIVAAKVKKVAPLSADIRLWAEDPKDKEHKVFDGLVLGEAAGRFREERIADFAKTRYIKAFQTAKLDRPQ